MVVFRVMKNNLHTLLDKNLTMVRCPTLPLSVPDLSTKLCHDMLRYAKKRKEKINMIKILFICHGTIFQNFKWLVKWAFPGQGR
jgi:hypothetical protein